MIDVNITELRANLPGYLSRTRNGERFRVLRRGQVVAVLSPPEEKREGARKGLAHLARTAWVGDVVGPLDSSWEADAPA
jgi:antitoxin (DNA-binding transcriptional repressor) of toxin-antitoxin stability system